MFRMIITLSAFSFFLLLLWAIVPEEHGNSVHQPRHKDIRKIISLSPSITAMIIDLESEHVLAGVTQYHPPLTRPVPVIGTITNPNAEMIIAINPDAVLASKEDAPTQKIDTLAFSGLALYTLPSAGTFQEICSNFMTVAQILNKQDAARKKIAFYTEKRKRYLFPKTKNAIILLSDNPRIAVSRRSYISNIFSDAGVANMLEYSKTAYPIVQQEYLLNSNVDLIIKLFSTQQPQGKHIITIEHDALYLYTPKHYCYALQHIASVLHQ